MSLQYRTAGESHGRSLTIFVEGLPAGLVVDETRINTELRRRQGGYGRGGRMKIEKDAIEVQSGVRAGKTIGSPLVMKVPNRDFRIDEAPVIHRPRPGHADLAGSLKWLTTDCRETLERASARETTSRVAAGALAKCLLSEFGIETVGFVSELLDQKATIPSDADAAKLRELRDANEAYTPDAAVAEGMIAAIRQAKIDKDTVGGIVEVRVYGCPPGLGSCFTWDGRLDGRLMQAVGSIQAFKGAEIGLGFDCGRRRGSDVHDPIHFDESQRSSNNLGFVRPRNNAGGLEGGMTNGMPVIVRGVMKPISTLLQGMDSVNLDSLDKERSDYERSDVCAVPAASVVAENVVAFEIARALLEKFSGDTLLEMQAAHKFYMDTARSLPTAAE